MTNIASSTILDQKAIYVFIFQVYNHSGGLFGICPISYQPQNTDAVFAEIVDNAYAFGASFGFRYKKIVNPLMTLDFVQEYGPSLKDEDIITMRFNKINGTS